MTKQKTKFFLWRTRAHKNKVFLCRIRVQRTRPFIVYVSFSCVYIVRHFTGPWRPRAWRRKHHDVERWECGSGATRRSRRRKRGSRQWWDPWWIACGICQRWEQSFPTVETRRGGRTKIKVSVCCCFSCAGGPWQPAATANLKLRASRSSSITLTHSPWFLLHTCLLLQTCSTIRDSANNSSLLRTCAPHLMSPNWQAKNEVMP